MSRAKQNDEVSTATAIDAYRRGVAHVEALVADAEVLLNAGRPLRAVALALFAMEELGKLAHFPTVPRYRQAGRMVDWWKGFRNHEGKFALGRASALIVRSPAEQKRETEWIASGGSGSMLNHIKISALYLDFVEGAFVTPDQQLPEAAATAAGAIADVRRMLLGPRWTADHATVQAWEATAAAADEFVQEIRALGLDDAQTLARTLDPELLRRFQAKLTGDDTPTAPR